MSEKSGQMTPVVRQKERAVETLTRHFTSGLIELDRFEEGLDQVYRSSTAVEIEAVLGDLPRLEAAGEGNPPARDDGPRRKKQFVGAVMGGTEQKGRWRPASQVNALALMGGVVLDFREAYFAPGVTELSVVALMGGVEIIVPPGLRVECEGLGILGGFEGLSSDSDEVDPGSPTLVVKGVAIFGGVDVQQRYPGESNREARKRVRHDRPRRV